MRPVIDHHWNYQRPHLPSCSACHTQIKRITGSPSACEILCTRSLTGCLQLFLGGADRVYDKYLLSRAIDGNELMHKHGGGEPHRWACRVFTSRGGGGQ